MYGALLACMLLGCHGDAPPPPERCTLRVSATGVSVDGDPVSREAAITTCKRRRGGAVVIVDDDARSVTWPELRAHLRRERIAIIVRGVVDDGPDCLGNPLARHCAR